MTALREAQDAAARQERAKMLAQKLCESSKWVVNEELALVAMQLNMEFLALESVREVAALADAVFEPNASIVGVLHTSLQEGETCVHIVLELLIHLTYSASACTAMARAGVVETLVSVLPALRDVAQSSALHLLDCLATDDRRADDDAMPSSRRICRVACARVLWTVLAEPSSSSSLSAASSLLAKISGALVSPTGGAAQQVVEHTLRRSPRVEEALARRLAHRAAWGLPPAAAAAVAHQLGAVLARVQRWRQSQEKPQEQTRTCES